MVLSICVFSVLHGISAESRSTYCRSLLSDYRANANYGRVATAVSLVWILSCCSTSIFFFVGFVAYAFVFANITMFCTIFIFIFSYVRIFQYAKNQITQIDNLTDGQTELNKARQRAIEMENKLTKTYLIMLGIFLSCYIPSCIMIYFMNLCQGCSCELIHWLRDFHFVFITINSLINPFLYAFRLPNFKSAVKRILGCASQVAPVIVTTGNEVTVKDSGPRNLSSTNIRSASQTPGPCE